MNDQIKGLLYFYMTSTRYSFIIFWSILLSILVFTLGISFILRDTDGMMTFSFTFPIVMYLGIYGYFAVKHWLPFMIKLGATRKNIFFSLAIYFTSVSIVFSMLASAIQVIVTPLVETLGMDIFSFIHLSYFFTDTWYTRIFIDTSLAMLLFTIFYLLTLFFYRYGLAVGFSFIGVLMLTFMLSMFQGWIPNFVINVLPTINLSLFGYITLIASIIYCSTWLLMRRVTTISAR